MGLLSKAAVKHSMVNVKIPEEKTMRDFIEAYQRTSAAKGGAAFHCIVINADSQKLIGMVSHIGAVTVLGGSACLVLLPPSLDRELLAHRLSKSLETAILCQCRADSAGAALEALAPFCT